MLKTLFHPILFYTNKATFNSLNNLYNIKETKKVLNNYTFLKKSYFILYYSDLFLLDKSLLLDFALNKRKVLKYLDLNKNNFLFFYYNNHIYTYKRLIVLLNTLAFNYNSLFYFLGLKNKNIKILNIIFYLKKKKCLQ